MSNEELRLAQRALAAWGDDAPVWVLALAAACVRDSQAKVAQEIGYSGTVVSRCLGNSYRGNIEAVAQAVQGAYMAGTVPCPVLGDLPGHRCMEYQRRPFANTNPTRIKLWKACRGCEYRRGA